MDSIIKELQISHFEYNQLYCDDQFEDEYFAPNTLLVLNSYTCWPYTYVNSMIGRNVKLHFCENAEIFVSEETEYYIKGSYEDAPGKYTRQLTNSMDYLDCDLFTIAAALMTPIYDDNCDYLCDCWRDFDSMSLIIDDSPICAICVDHFRRAIALLQSKWIIFGMVMLADIRQIIFIIMSRRQFYVIK